WLSAGLLSRQVAQGIDALPVHVHFVVQVRAGALTGAAHQGDPVAPLHVVAGPDQVAAVVGVQRLNAVTVVDLDVIAVPAVVLGLHNPPGRRRHNGRVIPSADVQAPVHLPLPVTGCTLWPKCEVIRPSTGQMEGVCAKRWLYASSEPRKA